MNEPFLLATLLGVALAVSALGFIRVVYFISLGYGFSVAAIALALGIVFHDQLSLASIAQLSLLLIYGLRLGWYIASRESQSSYQREGVEVRAREAGIPWPVRLAIWMGVAILYVAMTSPAIFLTAATSTAGSMAVVWIGIGITALGLAIEALADWQKSRFKKQHPDRFCNVGLYRLVRCPNYFGEILVWLGNFLAGMLAFSTWYHWVMATAGLVCITLIMMGSTKRLEAKQAERYGTRPEYQAYSQNVPVLFPFLPIYSLKNLRVFLE